MSTFFDATSFVETSHSHKARLEAERPVMLWEEEVTEPVIQKHAPGEGGTWVLAGGLAHLWMLLPGDLGNDFPSAREAKEAGRSL